MRYHEPQHLISSIENQQHVESNAADSEDQSDVAQKLDSQHNNRKFTSNSPASSDDDEYTTSEKLEERILGPEQGIYIDSARLSTSQHDVDEISDQLASDALGGDSDVMSQRKMGKAKEKRAKKAAKKQIACAGNDAEFKCAACQAGFPSKTRLFNHIKDLNHAQPVSKPTKAGKNKK